MLRISSGFSHQCESDVLSGLQVKTCCRRVTSADTSEVIKFILYLDVLNRQPMEISYKCNKKFFNCLKNKYNCLKIVLDKEYKC